MDRIDETFKKAISESNNKMDIYIDEIFKKVIIEKINGSLFFFIEESECFHPSINTENYSYDIFIIHNDKKYIPLMENNNKEKFLLVRTFFYEEIEYKFGQFNDTTKIIQQKIRDYFWHTTHMPIKHDSSHHIHKDENDKRDIYWDENEFYQKVYGVSLETLDNL